MSNFDFLGSFLGKQTNFAKDGHDVSNAECVSHPFAQHVPNKMYHCVPGEHYDVDVKGYVQTDSMREDNFTEIYQNMKAVFVPLSTIWRDYIGATQNSRDTRYDQMYTNIMNKYAPVFRLSNVLVPLSKIEFLIRIASAWQDAVPYWRDTYLYVDSSSISVYYHNIHHLSGGDVQLDEPLFVVNNTDPDKVSFSYIDISSNPLAVLFVKFLATQMKFTWTGSIDMVVIMSELEKYRSLGGTSIVIDFLRLTDNLGYGNYLPILDLYFKKLVKSYFDVSYLDLDDDFALDVAAGGGSCAVHIYQPNEDINGCWSDVGLFDFTDDAVSLLPFIAFQYYIYTCEVSNYRLPLTTAISYDSILESLENLSAFQSGVGVVMLNGLNNDDDIGTGNFDGSLVTVTDVLDGDPITSLSSPLHWWIYLFSLRNPLLPADIFTTMQNSVVSGSIPTTTSTAVNANMVQTLADTSALYKLRQDLLRSGVRRDKQMSVMFGTQVSNPLLHEVQILDSDKSSLNIQGLINQAETDVAPLGARGARGNGSSHLKFKFQSREFGYLFIVTSFTCRAYYESFMIDKSLTLHPSAWFNPRFNHLGLEAVGEHNISLFMGLSENYFGFSGEDAVAGFSARDWHLKQQVDKVHGLFTNYPFDISQSMVRNSKDELQSYNLTRGDSMFGGFVPTLIDQQTELFRHVEDMYYNPFMVNNVFVQMSDGLFHGDMSYDHFRCIFNYEVHKVSPMPKLGLLRLD